MKRLIIILFTLCLTAWCASAQYARPSVLNVRAGKVFADGVKLTEGEAFNLFADLNGYNRSFDYQSFRNGYKIGAGLMIGGAGASVLGCCIFYGAVMSVLLNGITAATPMIIPKLVKAERILFTLNEFKAIFNVDLKSIIFCAHPLLFFHL